MEIVDDVVSVRDRQSAPLAYLPPPSLPIPDEPFAAKHMPDLGHDVKDFKVFSWRLTNWKKLEKKITSPEFDCGGHRWSVPSSPSPPIHLTSFPGAYSYSRSETQTLPPTIPFQFTLITQIQKSPQKRGMLALNSPSSYPTSMTPPYTPSAVSLTHPLLIHLPMALVHKMPIIDSLPKSATGDSLVLANCANCSISKRVISVQPSKMSLPTSPSMSVYSKIPLASYGITLSSNVFLSLHPRIPHTTHQLRFKERDRLRWLEKPRSHLLHEFSSSVSLLYPLF